jgi:hypothetical protein
MYTGNSPSNYLSIQLINLQRSDGGTYEHFVNQDSQDTGRQEACIVHILGKL